ncbi:DUF4145 domain-containing protein [Enterococcus casseliflavus]|uniref:DUF4145 domain-containing protein n=1 Tax=Enterococcus casseliflavus TaxID=37734 RepID=UPI0018841C7E|nr:DUF4145 domain-containing protein [Enterococcus casseliflavus]MBE9907202.1 DUF4145 domain-containing protein [Enterococcus casseliflavus]
MNNPLINPDEWSAVGFDSYRQTISAQKYTCGYCSRDVVSQKGLQSYTYDGFHAYALVCPNCGCVSMISENGFKLPGSLYGKTVDNLPQEIKYLYDEARECYKARAYTGVVLLARKCLANVAISFGAEDGQKFINYVNYLASNGYIAPKSRNWVDEIRKEGNSATHNKDPKSKEEATKILRFLEMLLLINYEFNIQESN